MPVETASSQVLHSQATSSPASTSSGTTSDGASTSSSTTSDGAPDQRSSPSRSSPVQPASQPTVPPPSPHTPFSSQQVILSSPLFSQPSSQGSNASQLSTTSVESTSSSSTSGSEWTNLALLIESVVPFENQVEGGNGQSEDDGQGGENEATNKEDKEPDSPLSIPAPV
ncbi:hypothetical protein RSAG8_07601, partial [Rhizoctonia solani AG-8 WAC10335]